jgi:hypothetical protein
MSGRRKHRDDPVVEITNAPTSPRDELAGRERRYIISMSIRTLCFIGAVVSFGVHLAWLGAILMIASLILPMLAVVVANSMVPRIEGNPVDPGLQHRELGPVERDDEGDR